MDTNKQEDTSESTITIRFVVTVSTQEAANRLKDGHGFEFTPHPTSQVGYMAKEAETTFEDAITYAGTLQGIEGVESAMMTPMATLDTGGREE